ncbi:MAG TPA: hypothetical protein PLA50_04165 [Bacteroidia bacterium]|nr:hypothetical protein [Bacteroidia bacterium]
MAQRILFQLTESHLLVANTGKPFSKEGIKAVCYSDTSSKTGTVATQANSEEDARRWIAEIRSKKANTFSDPDQLRSASGTESRTAGDYSARLVLELLQNAVDAGRDNPIGYKGIGFRSVLNQSEIVEIHSGNFHVRWSEEDARNSLKHLGLADLPAHLPILELPAWNPPDDEIKSLQRAEYPTVIRLKVSEAGRQKVLDEWKKFTSDSSILLFIDGEIELDWRLDGPYIQWDRQQKGDTVTVSATNSSGPPSTLQWRTFQEGGAQAAYSVDGHGHFQPSSVSQPRLRCYFPANESPHPFPNFFLHHSKFDLQSDRESVKLDGPHLIKCLDELAQAMRKAAESIPTEGDLLDLLKTSSFDHGDQSKIESIVWMQTYPTLRDAPLSALGGRSIANLKICPREISAWPRESRLDNWNAFLAALAEVRPGGLDDLPILKPGIENEERQETLLLFSPQAPFTDNELRQQTWAPVESSAEPVSSLAFTVFLPPEGDPLDPPDGINIRFLKNELEKSYTSRKGTKLRNFLKKTLGVLDFSALGVIEHCVLKSQVLEKPHEPSGSLIRFLKKLREADEQEGKKPVESFDWEDTVRRELIQKLKLHCTDGHRPILEIYAGEQWTGDEFLERTYGQSRGFLMMPPPDDPDERKSWEGFWKWLGIGWCPKVLPIISEITCNRHTQKGWPWNGKCREFQGSTFRNQEKPSKWSNHCNFLSEELSSLWEYTPRLKSDWTIDGDDETLVSPNAFAVIGKHFKHYEKWINCTIGYSSNKAKDSDNELKKPPSYLAFLLKKFRWIPGSDGNIHIGNDVFQPSGPVAKSIPEFVTLLHIPTPSNDDDSSKIDTKFFRQCGIRSGWSEVEDGDWERWFRDAAKRTPDAEGQISIQNLYRAFLDHRKTTPNCTPLDLIPIWGIERTENEPEDWRLLRRMDGRPFFVDRPDLAYIHLPGLRVFPVRLDNLAEKAREHLSIRPLSKALSGTPLSDGEVDDLYTSRVKDRIPELVAYLSLEQKQRSTENLEDRLQGVDLRCVDELEVQFSIDGNPLGTPVRRKSFLQNLNANKWTVFVDKQKRPNEDGRWELFSEALLLACQLPTDKALIIRELLQRDQNDLKDRLIKLGVAPETAEALRTKRMAEILSTPSPPPQVAPEPSSVPISIPIQPPEPKTPDAKETERTADSRFPSRTNAEGDRSSSEQTTRTGTSFRRESARSTSSRPRPEEGMNAQRWLFGKIARWCNEKRIPAPKWEENRVDITIPVEPPIFIEAKRIEGRAIHLSRNQIKKAEEHNDRYVVALLRPTAESYECFFVGSPLVKFGNLPNRRIEWTWSVEKGPPFHENSWEPPDSAPSMEASDYKAEIILEDDFVVQQSSDFDEILGSLCSLPPNREDDHLAP